MKTASHALSKDWSPRHSYIGAVANGPNVSGQGTVVTCARTDRSSICQSRTKPTGRGGVLEESAGQWPDTGHLHCAHPFDYFTEKHPQFSRAPKEPHRSGHK